MSDQTEHPVGYMCPPVKTQFKKGTSGNPKGRPKKKEDIYKLLQRVLKRKVTLKDSGQKIPMSEALIRKLKDLALSGDRRAMKLQRRFLDEAGVHDAEPYDPEAVTQRVLKAFENMGMKVDYDG